MPTPPKPSDRRQRRNQRAELEVVKGGKVEISTPDLPGRPLKATRVWWDELWTSDLAQTFEPSDVPALQRLATMYDERERALRGYRKNRLVEGSQGQPVLNPLWTVIKGLDAEILKLEDRFGLSAKSRLQLGITFGDAQRSLADLTAALEVDEVDDDPFADEDVAS